MRLFNADDSHLHIESGTTHTRRRFFQSQGDGLGAVTGAPGDGRTRWDRRRHSNYVFWMTILGNLPEKSSAFCATNTAVLRAISR